MKTPAVIWSVVLAGMTLVNVAFGAVVQANFTALTRSNTALVGISATGDLRRSTDGGSTFSTTRTATSTVLKNLSGFGNTVIAVGDGGFIVRSTDGGQTWTDLNTTAAPAFNGELRDVGSKDGTFWVAVGKAVGNLRAQWSEDGGATWNAGTVPTLGGNLLGVIFDSSTTRWTAVGTDGILGARILNSTDGKTWTNVSVPSGSASLSDVASDGGGNLLAVGDAGTLLKSSNGGQSFTVDANSGLVSENLNTVVFASGSGFTAAGTDLVQVNFTVAGGATVTQAPVPGGGNVTALVVDSSGEVVVSGNLAGFQTITFTGPANQNLSATPITLSATASSGLAVSFSVVSGPATISGNQLTMTGVGTVIVRASQGGGVVGNTTFTAAPPVDRSFTVSKIAATVTLGGLSATFDGTAKSATATTNPSGLNVVFTYDGSSTVPTNAGSYAVVATIDDPTRAGTASGTLVIAKASQTITFAALADRPLPTAPITLDATATSTFPVTFSVVSGPATVNGSALTVSATGTVVVRASQVGDVNFAAAPDVDRSFNVSVGTATVTLTGLTVTFDGAPKSATATTDPSGLNVTFTYDSSSTAPTNVGSYAVVGTIVDANFQGSASGVFTITKADQSITFNALANRPFNSTPIALNATASSGLAVTFSIVSGPATISGTSLTLTGTGTVVVRASQIGSSNFNAATSVDRSFAVIGGFEDWRQTFFSAGELADAQVSGPSAIRGFDGFTNLLKYALGLTPTTDVTTAAPQMSATPSDWTFTYTRPASVVDITYEVEASTDLANWSTTGVTLELVSSSGGIDTWRARFARSAATKIFFRLKVSLIQPVT